MLQYRIFRGKEIIPHIDEIAALRIEVFREFPYLYEGNVVYEKEYLQPYVNSPNSGCTLVFDQGKAIGASTCIPLSDEKEVFRKPFINEDPDEVFYFGESVLKKEYRGRGVGVEFFRIREEMASSLPQIRKTMFCAIERPLNHPLRPDDYKPLDSFWKKRGYRKREDLFIYLDWQDVDKSVSDEKKLVFWEKELL